MPFYECAAECATTGVQIPPSCEINPRDGGINRLIFISCDAVFPADPNPVTPGDFGSIAEFQTMADNCQIMTTGRLKGQKPKGSVTTEKLTSCLPESPTGGEKTITFMDYNAYESLYDFDFWNEIYNKQSRWNVMAVGCDGRIYPATAFTIDIDEVIPEDSKSPSHFDGSILIDFNGIMKPIYLTGFVEWVESIMPTCGGNPAITDGPFDESALTGDDLIL